MKIILIFKGVEKYNSVNHVSKSKKNGTFMNRVGKDYEDFPGGSEDKEPAYNASDPGSIPGLGRSPGEGTGNPPQYSCLEKFHGVAESQTRLSN